MNDMSPEPQPEPSLREILTAITELSGRIAGVETTTGATHADVGQLRSEMGVKLDLISADIAQLRADVLHAKVDSALAESRARDAQTALSQHLSDQRPHGKAGTL